HSRHPSAPASPGARTSRTTSLHTPTPRAVSVTRDSHGRIKRSETAKRDFEHRHPCPSTGKTSGTCLGYVIDHVVPLKRAGADGQRAQIQRTSDLGTLCQPARKRRFENAICLVLPIPLGRSDPCEQPPVHRVPPRGVCRASTVRSDSRFNFTRTSSAATSPGGCASTVRSDARFDLTSSDEILSCSQRASRS